MARHSGEKREKEPKSRFATIEYLDAAHGALRIPLIGGNGEMLS
jgi:hypothetical protein